MVDAVIKFQAKLGDDAAILSKTTKANYIRDLIIDNAKKIFYDDPLVEIKEKGRLVIFVFKTQPQYIYLKFKKFNKYNRVAYSRTIQAYKYFNQFELFDERERTINLHAGYKLDDTGTQIECLIGYPNGDGGHLWTIMIPDKTDVVKISEIEKETTEILKPELKLRVNQIRKANERAS